MNYVFNCYDRNKKYLLTFLVLSICMVVIYTGRLIDFPKIGLLCIFIFSLVILFLPSKKIGIFVAMLMGGIAFAIITPVLNTPDETVHLSRTIHIAEGNVNMSNQNIHITEDYFDIYKNIRAPFTKSSLFRETQTSKQVKFGGEIDYRATNSYWFT